MQRTESDDNFQLFLSLEVDSHFGFGRKLKHLISIDWKTWGVAGTISWWEIDEKLLKRKWAIELEGNGHGWDLKGERVERLVKKRSNKYIRKYWINGFNFHIKCLSFTLLKFIAIFQEYFFFNYTIFKNQTSRGR